MAMFQLSRPGPRRALCPRLPQVGTVVPGTYSAENTEGSNHCNTFKLLLGEITEFLGYDTLPLRSGRIPWPQLETMEQTVVPEYPRFKGNPDSMVTMPLSCHPPMTSFAKRLEVLRKMGRS